MGQDKPSFEANSSYFQVQKKDANIPNAIFFHGENDKTIDPQQSVKMSNAIKEKGGESEVFVYPGESHAFFNGGNVYAEDVLSKMVQFFRKNDFVQ